MKKISRRSFLAVCGAMAATAALTACGGLPPALLLPAPLPAPLPVLLHPVRSLS